ncbi:hypothetical protein B0F90DRAFT_1785931 [Multifurca ochricompacta]|uniref:Uncharacterized protein n=1 Tax=Multifurca ochricompacta TaxID=376703 RepID=A0AAD4LUC0_9AGAM|nr:hypothetical protein B0F90DRAFT_1785931 [Multifurca ochricompacta]
MQFIKTIIALSLAAFVLAAPGVQPVKKRLLDLGDPVDVNVLGAIDTTIEDSIHV